MRTSANFGEKTSFGFLEIYAVSARTRRFDPVRTFFGQEEGSISRNFCADVLIDGPLSYCFKINEKCFNYYDCVPQVKFFPTAKILILPYLYRAYIIANGKRMYKVAHKPTNLYYKQNASAKLVLPNKYALCEPHHNS